MANQAVFPDTKNRIRIFIKAQTEKFLWLNPQKFKFSEVKFTACFPVKKVHLTLCLELVSRLHKGKLARQNGVDVKTVNSMLCHYNASFTLRTCTRAARQQQNRAAETNFMAQVM